MKASRQAAGLILAACLLQLLTGCTTRTALLAPDSPARPAVELTETPFYPQHQHQCGPAALATVLGASGITVAPDALVPQVYLPQRHGSIQVEMQAAPRRYARLAYEIEPTLSAIVEEIGAGRPVLVLHNYGLPFWPRWHYAVVIGYDASRDRMILRSGTTRRQEWSARMFMRAWDNGGRWGIVLLRPGELPAQPDRSRYLQAAAAFESAAQPADARLVFAAAVERWPSEPVAWTGRGTAEYRAGDLTAAAKDYAQALKLDSSQIGARNNLAMTLLDLGCREQARLQLQKIDAAGLPESLRAAVWDTRSRIEAEPAVRGARAACEAPL